MSLAEGVQGVVSYKAYAVGTITANAEAVSSSDLGASGAQQLRRVASTLTLKKATYQSNEIRSDRQIFDFRHGVRTVDGSLSGELSPATYFDFVEAACRGTKGSALTITQAAMTSVAFSNSSSNCTFAGGDAHTQGIRIGDIIRFTGLTVVAANNNVNFLVTSMSGSNRVLGLYPAPTVGTADTTFSLTTNGTSGKSIYVPSSSFVSRKFGIEEYHTDLDLHRLFTECRVGGFKLSLPPTGLSTIEIPMVGRDMETASGGSSPFFTSPTAPTTTGILAAVNGLLQVQGSTVGVVTGATLDFNMNPTTNPVVGQSFVPEIFLGRANVTGQLTALFQDLTMLNYFVNETEVSVLMYLTATTAANSPAMTIYLPRVKFGGGDLPLQGEAGQTITLPFQALKYGTAGAGVEATTIRIADTEAS